MSNFIKWPSAENSYRTKFIEVFLDNYPSLLDEIFIVTEKIHGSNWQWLIQPNEKIRCGSRNNYLDESGSFQGASIASLYAAHEELLSELQGICDYHGITIRLFGELFGKGIQKGVDYGDDKRLLYFGIMVNDALEPFSELERYVPFEYRVPVAGFVNGLQSALLFDTEFDSLVTKATDNEVEGVVISPYNRVFRLGHDIFMLKKKNTAFKEKESGKVDVVVDTEVHRLNNEFKLYINDNRLQSVFSKEGEINSPKEIGKYVKLILEDAKDDFLKDNDVSALDGSQMKKVFNVGRMVADMLKGYL